MIKQAENAYDAQIDYQRILFSIAEPICTRFDVSGVAPFQRPAALSKKSQGKKVELFALTTVPFGFPTCGNCFSLKAVIHSLYLHLFVRLLNSRHLVYASAFLVTVV